MLVKSFSLPFSFVSYEEIGPAHFVFRGATWKEDFGPFVKGEESFRLDVDYLNGKLVEYKKGEEYLNKQGYYQLKNKTCGLNFNLVEIKK